jgi:hypothetical protein
VNDKGRYRQQDAISKQQQRLQNICVSGSRARVYRRGADCHPLKKVASVVDVNIFLSCTPLALQASDLVPGSLSEMATIRQLALRSFVDE